MEKKSYIITICSNNADMDRNVIATLSEKELKSLTSPFNYIIDKESIYDVENAMSFSQLKEWLATARLTRTHYVLSDVKSKVIHLPNGVRYNPAGYLEIYLGKEFNQLTHDDALEEKRLQEWVLNTFPTSQYCCSRSKFTLPTKREEFPDKRHSVKWVFNISASGDGAIIEQKFIYKKVTEII